MAWGVSDYPEPKYSEFKPCYCPVCGDECDTLYIRRIDNEVVGCDQCIRSAYADEMDEG